MINLFKNNRLINDSEIKEILNDAITPELHDLGFKYNGDYLWHTDLKSEIRKILRYKRLKGETGIFEWGVCVDFIPMISGHSIKWDKTEKIMTLHLFDWPDDFADSFLSGDKNYSCASHWGKNEFKKTLKQHFDKNKDKIFDWFSKCNDINGLIKITQSQIAIDKSYGFHYPNPGYVLMFLYASTDRINDSLTILDKLEIDSVIKTKIRKLIIK
jgi:hypothetical protein